MLEPLWSGDVVDEPVPELPELPVPIEPLEPDEPPMEDPELPEEEPFGMISICVTLEPEKLART